MKNNILIVSFLLLTSLACQAVTFKITNLRVKPVGCDWSEVLKPCNQCDSLITANIDYIGKVINIVTPIEQVFTYDVVQMSNTKDYKLASGDALDYLGRKVWLGLYIYNDGNCFFHVKYSDGEYQYKIKFN